MENGIWFWKFQYPVRMRLVGQISTRPEQAFTFEMVKSGIMKRQMQPSGQVTPVTSASAPCTPNHPVKPLPGCWGYFHRKSGDSMAAATFPSVQFILVQVPVRTNDGGRQAVREYIVITDELRDTLSGSPMRHGALH